jgi:hypothetical protein
MSTIALPDAVRADPGVQIQSRAVSTIEHDYGQEGADVYWESQAAQNGVQAVVPGDRVSVGTAPPVQRNAGWYGRAGGYEGSDRVERTDELGQPGNPELRLLSRQTQTPFGRAGGPPLPTDAN